MTTQFRFISAQQPEFASVCKLYTNSFPPDERRPIEQLRHIALNQSRFSIVGIFVEQPPLQPGNRFAGFISFWRFDDFIYVEHLATEPHLRGGGLGRELIEHLKALAANLPVILEVEPPVNDIASRRIAFYKRLGFTLHEDFPYIQPAYSPATQPIALNLMSHNLSPAAPTFEVLRSYAHTIALQVYHNYY